MESLRSINYIGQNSLNLKSKMIRLQLCPMASSPAVLDLRSGAIQMWAMFWSLNIEIWYLRFGILFSYKTF